MNTITLVEIDIKPFELNLQNLHFFIKSLLMFKEYEKIISVSDTFYVRKDAEYGYLVGHKSLKLDQERILFCFQDPKTISNFGREKGQLFYDLFYNAWVDELL